MKRWSFKRDQSNFSFLASQRINALVTRLSEHPDDIQLMERATNILEILDQLSLDLDLWKAQNVYFAMGQSVFPEILTQSAKDELAAKWVALFERLGELLQVKIAPPVGVRRS